MPEDPETPINPEPTNPYAAPRAQIGSPRTEFIEDADNPLELRCRYLGRERAVKTLAHLVAASASALLLLGFVVAVLEIIGGDRLIDLDYLRPLVVLAVLDAMMLAFARGLLLLRPWAPRLGGWLFVISLSTAGMFVLREEGWVSADTLISVGLPILSGFAGLLIVWSKRTSFIFSDRYREAVKLTSQCESKVLRVEIEVSPIAKTAIVALVALTVLGIIILVSR